jgi:hypothetical protein
MEAHRVVRRRGSHNFKTIDPQLAVRSAPYTPAAFYSQEDLVLISVRGWVDPQGHSAAGRIRSIEKSNGLMSKRTRDLPACSIVPQPTTLPTAPSNMIVMIIFGEVYTFWNSSLCSWLSLSCYVLFSCLTIILHILSHPYSSSLRMPGQILNPR